MRAPAVAMNHAKIDQMMFAVVEAARTSGTDTASLQMLVCTGGATPVTLSVQSKWTRRGYRCTWKLDDQPVTRDKANAAMRRHVAIVSTFSAPDPNETPSTKPSEVSREHC